MLLYRSFISSNFSYCPVSWIFCGKRNSTKLEKLQERALRFVFSDCNSSYDELLKRGNMLSLCVYRLRFLAIEMYKCVNNHNPSYLNDLFEQKVTPYNMRDDYRLKQYKFCTVKYGYKSFKYYGAKLWNALPPDVKCSDNLNIFKRKITEWCHSSSCNDLIIF